MVWHRAETYGQYAADRSEWLTCLFVAAEAPAFFAAAEPPASMEAVFDDVVVSIEALGADAELAFLVVFLVFSDGSWAEGTGS